jgi:hypothetical protein
MKIATLALYQLSAVHIGFVRALAIPGFVPL